VSSVAPSSTTSKFFLGAGAFALLVGGIMLFAAALNGWHTYVAQHRWPLVHAVVQECKLDARARRRMPGRAVTYAVCGITFTDTAGQRVSGGFESLPAYYERRPASGATSPGVDELRAWVDQHPAGSVVDVHYDPDWPPSAEPAGPPEIFDAYPTRGLLKFAGIAALVGILLIGGAALLR
jgi:hypothetical protein